MGPGFFSVIHSNRTGSNRHKLNQRKFHINVKTNFFTELQSTGARYPEMLWNPLLWRYSKPTFLCYLQWESALAGSWAMWSPDVLQPLWFCLCYSVQEKSLKSVLHPSLHITTVFINKNNKENVRESNYDCPALSGVYCRSDHWRTNKSFDCSFLGRQRTNYSPIVYQNQNRR